MKKEISPVDAVGERLYFEAVRLPELTEHFCGLFVLGQLHLEARVDVEGGSYRPLNKSEMKIWRKHAKALSRRAFENVSRRARFTRASPHEQFWRVETPGLQGAGLIVQPAYFPEKLRAPFYVTNGQSVFLADLTLPASEELGTFILNSKEPHPFRAFQAIPTARPIPLDHPHEPYDRNIVVNLYRTCPELFGHRFSAKTESLNGIDDDRRKNVFNSRTEGWNATACCENIHTLGYDSYDEAEVVIEKAKQGSKETSFMTTTGVQLRVVPIAASEPDSQENAEQASPSPDSP